MPQVMLKDLAFARSGDKGDVCNVGVMAMTRSIYEFLIKELTPERVKGHFKGMVKGDVEVYHMPNIDSIELVLRRSLGGGATCTLRFDQTGKSMCTAVLRMTLDADDRLVQEAREASKAILERYGC
ncbi:MAG: hypothetical protein P8182_00680 [Deltaproteobacteria bacterium]|jgi:hypothetical protein